jgi:hypothetical protein
MRYPVYTYQLIIYLTDFYTVTSSVNLFLSSRLMSIRCVFGGLLEFRGCCGVVEAVVPIATTAVGAEAAVEAVAEAGIPEAGVPEAVDSLLSVLPFCCCRQNVAGWAMWPPVLRPETASIVVEAVVKGGICWIIFCISVWVFLLLTSNCKILLRS